MWLLVGGGVLLVLLLVCGGVGTVAAVMLWPATKATPENFAKIKAGMTEKQVIEILGPPGENVNLGNNSLAKMAGMQLPNIKTLAWRGKGGSEFMVQLLDGKVMSASGMANGKMLNPVMAGGDVMAGLGGGGDLNNSPPPQPPQPPPDPPGGGVGGNPTPPDKGEPTKPVKRAIDRIIRGMGEKDVVDRLGKPFTKDGVASVAFKAEGLDPADTKKPTGGFKHVIKYLYFLDKDEGGRVHIYFADGKVIKVEKE